ncbi:hypothetical protein KY362_04745 [Candidatus Woesearchaeota archaeon]|nr:hypothetical protein [Candidatus Woesearchaeota archaeon]
MTQDFVDLIKEAGYPGDLVKILDAADGHELTPAQVEQFSDGVTQYHAALELYNEMVDPDYFGKF